MITHDYEFILSACDDVLHIEQGEIHRQYELDMAGKQKVKHFFGFDAALHETL